MDIAGSLPRSGAYEDPVPRALNRSSRGVGKREDSTGAEGRTANVRPCVGIESGGILELVGVPGAGLDIEVEGSRAEGKRAYFYGAGGEDDAIVHQVRREF